MTLNTREKILELAQDAIASRGYSAFSFRELAAELGIKSASIHYHFPTKTHLGVAVARAWRERLELALKQIAENNADPAQAIRAWIGIYRQEASASQRMTVCTMLAAEIKNLPDSVQGWFETGDSIDIIRIEVNNCSLQQLMGHPYIGFYQARAITDYRRAHGEIGSLSQLSMLPEFSDADIRRLSPYLRF